MLVLVTPLTHLLVEKYVYVFFSPQEGHRQKTLPTCNNNVAYFVFTAINCMWYDLMVLQKMRTLTSITFLNEVFCFWRYMVLLKIKKILMISYTNRSLMSQVRTAVSITLLWISYFALLTLTPDANLEHI